MKARTMEEAVAELVNASSASDREEAAAAVLKREREGSTAIGSGIALPHARTSAVSSPDGVIGLSRGIPANGDTVRIFVLFLIPVNTASAHVLLLSDVVKVLSDESRREALLKAGSLEEAAEVLGL